MAKLKFEFLATYYQKHLRRLRDYFFGYFHITAKLLSSIAPVVNVATSVRPLQRLAAQMLNITADRPFPKFANWHAQARPQSGRPRVILLRDPFTHYIEPHVEQAAFDLLDTTGFDVLMLPTLAANAALMSKGFLRAARSHASTVLDALNGLDPARELPIVGLEPSELYALKHETADLVPDRRTEAARRGANTWLLEELLVRSGGLDNLRVATKEQQILFHPHCHQKAEGEAGDGMPAGSEATISLLRACGYEVKVVDAGCCGMAGTFGYESEHYQLSQQVGALKLFPQIRNAVGMQVVATGAACRMQIAQRTGADVQHPVVLAAAALQREYAPR
jgi:Fe-S oxidoreductase